MAIYYLDIDDEITSAAARIRGSVDAHIALVMPAGSRVATSRINFKLLEREAKQRNKRLAIVAPDPSVRSLAQSAGLPVFANVREYEAAEAGRPKGASPTAPADVSETLGELGATIPPAAAGSRSIRGGGSARGGPGGGAASTGAAGSADGAAVTSRRRRRLGVASLVLIGLLAVMVVAGAFAAYQLWPSATVVLTVNQKPLGPLALTVNIDPSVVAINYSTLTVPGITKSFDVNQSGTFDASGQSVVETAATGTVTFTNANNGTDVSIPVGTRVTTASGVAFTTTKTITVPKAGTIGLKIIPTTADAPVVAVSKGLGGNVGAGTIVNMSASLAADLVVGSVTNKSPTSGGTHVVTPVVLQTDLDKATASLTKSLNDSFAATLKDPGGLSNGVQLFSDTGRLGAIAFNPEPATLLKTQASSFELTAKATGTATEADTANVRSLAESRITSKVRSGYILVDGSVKTTLGTPTAHGAVVSVPVTANAAEAATVSVAVLKANIKGKSVAEARAYLSQFGDAKISLSPWWASTIPTYDFRIDLSLVAPNSAASSQSPGKSSAAVTTASAAPGASASGPAGPSASASASASSSAGSSSSASSVPSSSVSSSASSSAGTTASATASPSTVPSASAS